MDDGRERRVLGGLSVAAIAALAAFAYWPAPADLQPLLAQASCASAPLGRADPQPYSVLVPGGRPLKVDPARSRQRVDANLSPLTRVNLLATRSNHVLVHLRMAATDVCGWVNADDLVGSVGSDLSALANGPHPIPANSYGVVPPIGAYMRVETLPGQSRLKLHTELVGAVSRELPVRPERPLAFHVFRFIDADARANEPRRRWYLVGVREETRVRIAGWVSDEQVASQQVRERTFALEPAGALALAAISSSVCGHDGRRAPLTPVWRDIGNFVGDDVRRRADGPGHLLTAVFGVPREAVSDALFDTWTGIETRLRHLPGDQLANLSKLACRAADALAALKPLTRDDAEDVALIRVPLDILR